MKRVLCLWLPNWPIQRLVVARPALKDRALVVKSAAGHHGQHVVACSRQASHHGIRVGMPLAEATALWEKATAGTWTPLVDHASDQVPSSHDPCVISGESDRPVLCVAPDDPLEEQNTLEQLAHWCHQFSPLVAVQEPLQWSHPRWPIAVPRPDGLLLEASGMEGLYASERAFAEQVQHAFRRRGYFPFVALASTVGTAWAVARWPEVAASLASVTETNREGTVVVVRAGAERAVLAPLPVEALRLPPQTILALHEVGIRRVEQLLDLPRTSLPSRFGTFLLQRLDQALGRADDVTVHVDLPEPRRWEASFEYPTKKKKAIETVLQKLFQQMVDELARRDQGVLRVEITLQWEPAVWEKEEVSSDEATAARKSRSLSWQWDLFQPATETACLQRLLQWRMEQLVLPGAVHRVEVVALTTGPCRCRQPTLFDQAHIPDSASLADLMNRLRNRLGADCVLRAELQADGQPERAFRLLRCDASWHLPVAGEENQTDRPSLMIHQPLEANDRPLELITPPREIQVLALVPDGTPVRFAIRHRWFSIARCWGPERIETGWWRGSTVRRDYYRVETRDGRRFWLFHQLDQDTWFLHGVFG